MAVISSSEIAEQRRGPTFDGDGSFHRKYTRVFQVITDNYKTAGLQALIQGTAIPPIYSYYDTRPQGGVEYDTGALLLGYDSYQPDNDTPNRWLVRCDYASRGLDPDKVSAARGANPSHEGGGDQNENPLLKPTKITYRNNSQRRTAYNAYGIWRFDATDNPVFTSGTTRLANAAGQAYNPGPEISAPQKTLTIVRNESSYDVNAMMLYEDKVNSSTWLGFPEGAVKCDFIDGESAFENGRAFVTVTYQFSVRRQTFNPDSPGDPWDWAPVNQGTFYLDGDGNVQNFGDSNGNFNSPGYLDDDGHQLGETADPVIYAFRVYDRMDFTSLGLP